MSDPREKLLEAYRGGSLVETALELSSGSNEDRNQVTESLVALHNEDAVDIIEEFKGLRNSQDSGPDFFLARHILEGCLPHLTAPLLSVMECVAKLAEEAGQDMAANTIFAPFIDFCSIDISRPVEGLKLIEESPKLWANFVCPFIVAGTRLDMSRFYDEAITLTSHEDIEIRRNAIFSLGRIQFHQGTEMPMSAIRHLENLVDQNTDDLILGNIVKSVCSIFRQHRSQAVHIDNILDAALSKGQDHALHAASEEFGFRTDELTPVMLHVIMHNLMHINPSNKGTIDNIDYGIADLLKKESHDQAVEFLEKLLLTHPSALSLKLFDSVIHQVLSSGETPLNKLLTRWFLKGDRVLCDGIRIMLNKVHGKDMHLEVDPTELPSSNTIVLMFLAKKTIGYLFYKPITSASIITSLMRQTDDPDALKGLASLLFDPLLLNYAESVGEYLEACVSNESGKAKESIQEVLDDVEKYFDDLRSIGNLPEMHPSQDQREAYSRHFNQQLAWSYKEAMKGSFVSLLFSKAVLLYGRKSINYIDNGSGEAKRMEIPLQSHGTEMEFPRREHIDPFGLDYMLRLFRVERLVRS